MPLSRVALSLALVALTLVAPWSSPPALRAQGVDVFLNITGGGVRKLNIAVPEFTATTGTEPAGMGKMLSSVAGADLTFSGLFSVVTDRGPIPANNPAALKQALGEFAAAGAHAAVHGLLTARGQRLEGELRLYDVTTPDQRLIATKKFDVATDQPRRLAHKMADEVVLQFTGEAGIADTRLAYVAGPRGAKEIALADYDGFNPRPVTKNGSINLSPVWSPDGRSIALTSYRNGYPDLFRAFPYERRPDQVLAAFPGINSSPAWSPDGRSVAMTLSRDGNPEVYVLTIATGNYRRLTRHAGIDTEPTWSPDGRLMAFVSDRTGTPHIYVMDTEGANVRQLTTGGYQTQPRWSPKGDVIVFTTRAGTHDLWAIRPDGSSPRRLTSGPGDNQGATWAPNGRHLAFQSNRQGGAWQIFAMLADGTEQVAITRGPTEHTSPSWSPRLP
jgi:TolB protein